VVEPVAKARGVRPQPRDDEILRQHFGAFRFSTYEALHRIFWPDHEIDAVKKWVERMHAAGYVRTADLYAKVSYLSLTPEGAARAELPERYARPLDDYHLAQHYGVLSLCCLGPVRYRKLSAQEFATKFPELCVHNLETDWYYLDHDFQDERFQARNRIGYIYVDVSRRLRDVKRRFEEVLSKRLGVQIWRETIQRGQFIYTIVTTTASRQGQLERFVKPHAPPSVPVRFAVRRDLLNVMPQKKRHASQRSDNA